MIIIVIEMSLVCSFLSVYMLSDPHCYLEAAFVYFQ